MTLVLSSTVLSHDKYPSTLPHYPHFPNPLSQKKKNSKVEGARTT